MKEDFNNVREALLKRGYQVSVFSTAGEAVEYLDEKIDGTSVSFGGSMTLEELGLPERLAAHNTIRHLWRKVKGRVISVPLKNEKNQKYTCCRQMHLAKREKLSILTERQTGFPTNCTGTKRYILSLAETSWNPITNGHYGMPEILQHPKTQNAWR